MAIPQRVGPYWRSLAGAYPILDSPLRPSPEDLKIIASAAETWRASNAGTPVRALLLGVTPSIATMNWPDGSRMFALDSSAAMVGSVWPGDVPGVRSAACGDWRAIPAPTSSFNLVVGDGSLNCLPFPNVLEAVLEELSRTMTQCGILVLRGY